MLGEWYTLAKYFFYWNQVVKCEGVQVLLSYAKHLKLLQKSTILPVNLNAFPNMNAIPYNVVTKLLPKPGTAAIKIKYLGT